MKCLFYGEVPSIETGAARISQHLLNLMMELEWEIDVVGINGFDDLPHDEDKWPFRFFDVHRDNPRDPEKAYNMKNAEEQILKGDYDVLFLTGDIQYIYAVLNWAFEARAKFHTTIIALVVIDSDFDMPYLHEVAQCDVIAVYSKFAQDVFERRYPPVKGKLLCTTLGCEIDSYYPLTPEQRRKVREEAFKVSDDTFLVGIFNRNQYRKDIMRGAYAFHLFHQQYPNSVLFICAQRRDLAGHMPTQAHLLGIPLGEPGSTEPTQIIWTPLEYNIIKGYPRDVLNQAYNACDVCISTSQGEGWGLTTTESMAAGTPFIGPRHTTFLEILGSGEERGYLAAAGGPDLWMIHYSKGDEPRPITSVTDMVAKLERVYLQREEAKEKAARAREWALAHTWTMFVNKWREILVNTTACLIPSMV